MRCEVIKRPLTVNGEEKAIGDTVELPAADANVLIDAGRLKKAAAAPASTDKK
jgi:hypothetical protein